jgi:uncharacterized protein YhfF
MIGKKTEAVETFWQACREGRRIEASSYHASTFADPRLAPYHDTLLDLVGAGKKRGTAHLVRDFEENAVVPRKVGDYWVVLDVKNTPRYLIQVTDIAIKPFNEVDATFAAREGEGDSSLAYWQDVHRDYFQQQCAQWSIPWSEDYPTVCEGFRLIEKA